VKFWDSSAIVPLLLGEEATAFVRGVYRRDRTMVVWWAADVECESAISRREREGKIRPEEAAQARERLEALSAEWSGVEPAAMVRAAARRFLRVHPLRAADALQLAAAWVASEQDPGSLPVVCLDSVLSSAARREGFGVPRRDEEAA
jgi:predicted nucleic acid-binding protein